MEIKITSTDQITKFEGKECRVWEGVTARGVACKVFVLRIAVPLPANFDEFDRELKETLPPGLAVPLRMVLP